MSLIDTCMYSFILNVKVLYTLGTCIGVCVLQAFAIQSDTDSSSSDDGFNEVHVECILTTFYASTIIVDQYL